MQFDKLTIKSQEAIQAAQQIAQDNNNQEIKTTHLVKAILEQAEGAVVPVLQKMGFDPSTILSEINKLIEAIPQVSGSGAGQAARGEPRLREARQCRGPADDRDRQGEGG